MEKVRAISTSKCCQIPGCRSPICKFPSTISRLLRVHPSATETLTGVCFTITNCSSSSSTCSVFKGLNIAPVSNVRMGLGEDGTGRCHLNDQRAGTLRSTDRGRGYARFASVRYLNNTLVCSLRCWRSSSSVCAGNSSTLNYVILIPGSTHV